MRLSTLSLVSLLALGAAGTDIAAQTAFERSGLPPFEDPYAEPGAPVDCAGALAREREKLACGDAPTAEAGQPAPAGGGGFGGFGAVAAEALGVGEGSRGALLAFADPYRPDAPAPACADLAGPEREKFGHTADCGAVGRKVAEPTPPRGGERPLRREDIPDLYRRVLSLPGARIATGPGVPAAGPELPAFTIFHVYEERQQGGETWLRVGKSAFGEIDGWLRGAVAEDWPTMLVMQYAPKGARGPVLFFRNRQDLAQFATDRYVAEEVRLAYEQIERGDARDGFFIAIEPSVGVAEENFYVMPILDHQFELSASGQPLRLLEVASLNTEGGVAQQDVREGGYAPAATQADALRDLRIGVVFVIDTTSSMGPYIDYTRAIVRSTVQRLVEAGTERALSFGLVGYRDNMSGNPNIGYVSRVFQPLDPNAPSAAVLANFEAMEPARASTRGFSEDAYAGIHAALNGLDWGPYDARFVILISDAAPRHPFDPLSQQQGYGPINIVEDANRNGVALAVLHLITDQGLRTGNVAEGEGAYRAISRTGDQALEKYFPVDTRDTQAFIAQVRGFQGQIVNAVASLSQGRAVERIERAPEARGGGNLGDVIVNEIFRAQLEYLGEREGQAAPRFYRAWAADKDLRNPRLDALEVKVFLTRNQVAALNKGVETILDAYQRQETGGTDFFTALQQLSAQTSVEGGRSGPVGEAGDLLPSFLRALPYKSRFLSLRADQWRQLGITGQRDLIEGLRSKLRAYRDLAQQRDGWLDLGAGDRGLEVSPISLDLMP